VKLLSIILIKGKNTTLGAGHPVIALRFASDRLVDFRDRDEIGTGEHGEKFERNEHLAQSLVNDVEILTDRCHSSVV
jgi:hypothetical protein